MTEPSDGATASSEPTATPPGHLPYRPPRLGETEMLRRGEAFCKGMQARRSVRAFSRDAVPREAIEWAVRTAGSAPSGAHQQPWTFVLVDDPALKAQIRAAAEAEERQFYEHRAPEEWLEALAPLGTSWEKPFLEDAPWLLVVFEQSYGLDEAGERRKHYYVRESVGLAAGLLLAALTNMGLATLTHTPSPMGFLSELLQRPANERATLLIPVGYAAPEATVPDLQRKPLEEILVRNV